VAGIRRQVIKKLSFLTQATLDFKRSASQIVSTVLSISLELSSFQVLLMTLQRGPVNEYFFTIENALRRTFPIHLSTITSWEAFTFVLSEKFRGSRGTYQVQNRRYKLIEQVTRREIDQSKQWEKSFLPYQKVVMSLLCKDAKAPLASTSDLATCP